MIRTILSRDDLGSFIAKPDIASLERTLTTTPRKNHVVMEFDEEALSVSSLPNRIIVPDDELEQLFAWIATYFGALSPITPVIDVIPSSEDVERRKPKITQEWLRVLTAITIIEAATQVRKSKARVSPGLLAGSIRSVSWVYTQCILRGHSSNNTAAALERWLRVRSALTGVDTPLPMEYIVNFWNEILPLFGIGVASGHNDGLGRVNREMLENGSVPLSAWSQLSRVFSRSADIERALRGPRQERVEIFDEAVRVLSGDPSELNAAFCGYLASRVSDGGLELWSVVLERSTRLPSMPLWFAFYAGSNNGADLLGFENAMSIRLANVLSDVSYDIDAREFIVLSRGKGITPADIPVESPGAIKVRLLPGVISSFVARDASGQLDERKESRERRDESQSKQLLSDARLLSDRMTATLVRLQQSLEATATTQQSLDLNVAPRAKESGRAEKDQRRGRHGKS